MRAHWGEPEPEEDPDPPLFMFEALFRVDPEEAFFHACNLPSCPSPTGDPWDITLHDYETLSRRWLKYPPPHIVAGSFVTRGDGKPKPQSKTETRKRMGAKTQAQRDQEAADTYALATGGMGGMIRSNTRTAKEQARWDASMALHEFMKKPGAKLSDFPAPWKNK